MHMLLLWSSAWPCMSFEVVRRSTVRPRRVLSSTTDTPVEVILNEEDDEDENDWLPDHEKARRKRLSSSTTRIPVERLSGPDDKEVASSSYTEEEERLIAAMGGKTFHPQSKREAGFLGDSTLSEIAQDYSIPICYIADVLCTWGVPIPIYPHDRLGDVVTGEQAFALLEAVNSLDVGQVQDRYSNTSLINLCSEWNIDLQTAFEFAMKEGWNLPFGVQTCLRLEQEDELLRVHGVI